MILVISDSGLLPLDAILIVLNHHCDEFEARAGYYDLELNIVQHLLLSMTTIMGRKVHDI